VNALREAGLSLVSHNGAQDVASRCSKSVVRIPTTGRSEGVGVVVDHSGLTVEGGRRVWKAQVAWVLCAGALGFAEAAFFSGLLRMPRYWFLVAYVVVTGAFLYAYFRSSGIDFGRYLRRRWI
jgi:hypothetical protein